MKNTNRSATDISRSRQMLNKVPEVTLYFWIIKILCTTVGESAADFLNEKFNLGLTATSLIMGGILLILLFFQFQARKYVPPVYWLVVVFISVVGTLITDNLTDNLGVSLVTTTIIFGLALTATFGIWYSREKTLSIHSIFTTPREGFYWFAILVTFALGTAAGDLLAEKLNMGYLISGLLFAGLLVIVTIAHFFFKLNAVAAFWIAYILTRPLGASFGDYLSQDPKDGGLGLGTTITSIIFLAAILVLVIYLTITKKDEIKTVDSKDSL